MHSLALGVSTLLLLEVGPPSNPSPGGKAMATKAHRRTRHIRRRNRVRRFEGQWLIALLARTLASIVVMVVARLLGLTAYGGH